ncbi:MAG: ATP-binding cassette domain-containing protein [Gammaproteobacteria bacterium]|nr:ATP-binding cassette domain-containing protein [Gammaproteobacteria bacterium]NKB65116.1 ATP-binding cassette domain-containing protein [Gammaproteobacteria bacterium]
MNALLEVRDLIVEFKTRDGIVRVLDQISFDVNAGEILGIVGESGCGKSMTALSLMGLVPTPPGNIAGGRIAMQDQNLLDLDQEQLRHIRGSEISMIFQEPMSSLNPVFTVGEQIAEALRLHEKISSKEAMDRAIDMLQAVDIPEPESRSKAYPHQLSGGMRQRVMIAIGLACRPKLLIADEPTTALDATVQAQIFDLLKNLQKDMDTAIILITHDMGAIAELADRVAVMYAGRIVEQGSVVNVLMEPKHPYTKGLIDCVPHLETNPSTERKRLTEIPGVVPALDKLNQGCAFAPRCAQALSHCNDIKPQLDSVDNAVNIELDHADKNQELVACHLYGTTGNESQGVAG